MRMRKLRPHCGAFWLASLLLATLAAHSTVPAATLKGIVVDENSVPVSGVAVRVAGPAGTQTAYTNEAGRFEFGSLGRGENRLSLNKPGFFRISERAVQLSEGVNEVSFTLNHESEIRERVEVHSSPTGVEPEEPAHQATLVARDIREIPVPSTHDLRNSLPALPGVVLDNFGRLHVAGGRSGETQLQLDGFEIGDPASGDLAFRMSVDTVRAAEVQTGRYSAQYGHGGAGVLSLDTAVGDDRWHFGTTNFIPGLNVERGVHFGNWYPRVTISGPLHKGRAWFSDAVSIQHTFRLVSELPRNADTVTQWAGDNLLRAQINLTPHQLLQGSFLYNQESDSHLGLGPFSPLSTTINVNARRYFVSLRDQIWVRNTLFELGVAADTRRVDSSPLGSQPLIVTPSAESGNFFETLRRRARRWQFIGNVVAPSRHWRGSHDVQAGVNVDAVALTHLASRNAINSERADNTLVLLTTFSGPPQFRVSNTQIGGYAQDAWRVSRVLLLQLGVRADGDRIGRHALVEPRLAANFLPFGDDRAKLAVGWGVYHQPIDLSIFGNTLDQQRTDIFFDATGRNPVLGPIVSRFVLPARGLSQPRFYTTSAEWSQKVGERTLASIHFIDREERAGLAYESLQPDGLFSLQTFLLQNNRHDRYRSVEFSLRHSFNDRAEVLADYTRARARTNEVLNFSPTALVFARQARGPLAWDAPNRVISWGWTPTPLWGLTVSYFLEYRTGFPFSVFDQQQQLVGAPNRLRFPDYFSLNVGVEKRFQFRGHEWAARLAVINATGHGNPNSVVNNVDAPNFLTFAGGQHRAFTGRLRLVSQK